MKKAGLPNSAKTENEVNKVNQIFGDGEMGDHSRAFDWSKTKLGPIHSWPPCTKSEGSCCYSF